MKTVSILYHIIKNYMIRNKSIFIVFITSYILMGLLIVFIYGAFFPYVSERRSKDLLDCRYIVNFDGEMPVDYLSRFYQNMFIKDSRHFEVETRLSGQADSLSIHSVFSPEHDVILALKQSGRLYFTEDEIKNSERVAIVTPDLGQLGDTITVDAIGDLKIIGVLDTIIPRSIYIPCSLFLNENFTVNTMYFVVQSRLNLQEIKSLEDFLYANENVFIVQGPAPTMSVITSDISSWLISFFIILLVIFILFLFFAQYMSEKNKRVYAILGILGERKEGILFLLIIERGTLVLTSMCVASVIHFFIRNTLHRILNLPDCKMIFYDYVIVALLCFLASLITAIPYAVSYLFKQYTVQLKQSE